jgi:hypothetical protein
MQFLGEWNLMQIRRNVDDRGTLIYAEVPIDVPFGIRRVYVLTSSENLNQRGNHAHRNLEQFIFAVGGAFRIDLDNGKKSESIILRPSEKGLYIKGLVWRTIVPQEKNSSLVVLASEIYLEEDYIRDYHEFRITVGTLSGKGLE